MDGNRFWVMAAGLGGFAGVALGAVSAHATNGGHDSALLDTAARYLSIHSVAILATGSLGKRHPTGWLAATRALFLFGMTTFAGGLTLLAFYGWPIAAAATPIGGTALLLGWGSLAVYGARKGEFRTPS
jgi:uncharacterized membrane protein YgdD (TMEM256/DUF423 family)